MNNNCDFSINGYNKHSYTTPLHRIKLTRQLIQTGISWLSSYKFEKNQSVNQANIQGFFVVLVDVFGFGFVFVCFLFGVVFFVFFLGGGVGRVVNKTPKYSLSLEY